MGDNQHTLPDTATRKAEAEAARAGHRPDRPATPEEAELVEGQRPDPAVARAFAEANERGAAQKGEGRID